MTRVSLLCLCELLFGPALTQFAPVVRTVETPHATLRLGAESRDLVGLDWKTPTLPIIAESRLGANLHLLLPRPGYEAAYFNSREQNVSRIVTTHDGVLCAYDSFQREGEQVPIEVQFEIRTAGAQIQFSIKVANQTDKQLAEVPYGIPGADSRVSATGWRPSPWSPVELGTTRRPLFHSFSAGSSGGSNLGIRRDAADFTNPGSMAMG